MALTLLVVTWLLVPLEARSVAPQELRESTPISLRSLELLRLDCWSAVGRREVTLFGNGTVRLREGLEGRETLRLLELSPAELEAYSNRLLEEDLAETERRYETVEGLWVERCTLEVDLPSAVAGSYAFGRYDTLSLPLQRIVGIAMELVERAEDRPPEGASQLPTGYEPAVGDVLRRVDGVLFEVQGRTADELGLELQGVNQPLTVYIAKDRVAEVFVALVSRGRIRNR